LDKVYLQASLVWKGLRESLKLPNNNYSVLLMKHFQVYWQTCLMKIHFLRNVWHNGFFKNKVNVLRYCFFSGHAFFHKTGMFAYCITDMTVTSTLIKNPPNRYLGSVLFILQHKKVPFKNLPILIYSKK
jgi:hypothetical protein